MDLVAVITQHHRDRTAVSVSYAILSPRRDCGYVFVGVASIGDAILGNSSGANCL